MPAAVAEVSVVAMSVSPSRQAPCFFRHEPTVPSTTDDAAGKVAPARLPEALASQLEQRGRAPAELRLARLRWLEASSAPRNPSNIASAWPNCAALNPRGSSTVRAGNLEIVSLARPCCWRVPIHQKAMSPRVVLAQSTSGFSQFWSKHRKLGQAVPPIDGSGVMQAASGCELIRKSRLKCRREAALLHGPEQIADLPVPVGESPGAVSIGHAERGHLVEYLAPNSVFNSLPRQRSSPASRAP